ncbi:MAG: restriction endonuclease subunit S [Candidatus Pacebacteria bacterium]|nr:restriction endonuclease subunit S [Candidatus Paceibacterota bacterium]
MTTTLQKIPTGYKQTDVGVIPTDWVVKTCAELGSFYKGRGISSRDLVPDGLPCIMYGDIYVKFDTKFSSPDFRITKETAAKSSMAKSGDLFFTGSGETAEEIGKCVVYQGKKNIYIGGDIIALSPNSNTDSLFLAYLQNSPLLLSQKANLGQGYTVVHIYTEHIKSLKVPLPPTKNEQTAIATTLSDVDATIEKLSLLVEKKKNIKHGAMRELLTGKRRLTGFNGKWKMKKLGELLDYEQPTPYLVKTKDYSDNHTVPVLTAGKTFILGYTAEDTGIFKNLPAIIFDDFTTATKYVDFPFKAKSSAMKILVPKTEETNLKFVFAKMQLIDFKLGDHKRYWISEYRHIEIATPEPEEQTAITNILSDMDAEIEKLESQLTKYRDLKQGMMQSLLTGKIRLLAK